MSYADLTPLGKWLNTDTWYTGHPCDMKRFHLALKAILSQPDSEFCPERFKQYICDHQQERLDEDYLEQLALKYSAIASHIYDYLIDIK